MSNSYLKNQKLLKVIAIAAVASALVIFAAITYSGQNGADTVDALGDSMATETVINASEGAAKASDGTTAGTRLDDSASTKAGSVAMSTEIYVDVGGAVKKTLVAVLPYGSRVSDAIDAAGGLSKGADVRYINRAALLSDGDRVYIPSVNEIESGALLPASIGVIGGQQGGLTSTSGAEVGQGVSRGAEGMININSADSTALQQLNGVGPSTAQKIIDYREQNGLFSKIEDIKNVSGIGEKTFEKLKDHITV